VSSFFNRRKKEEGSATDYVTDVTDVTDVSRRVRRHEIWDGMRGIFNDNSQQSTVNSQQSTVN